MTYSKKAIISTTPVRICDIGGWLDTWFSQHGSIVNFGVYSKLFDKTAPFRGIETILTTSKPDSKNNYLEIITIDPKYDISIPISDLSISKFDHTDLLLSTVYHLIRLFPNNKLFRNNIQISINSPIPPGASMGTSASICVSLIKTFLPNLSPSQVAKIAWEVETKVMKKQSGTQDQFSSSFGNPINNIIIIKYPETICEKITIPKNFQNKVEDGLISIFYGNHDSSKMHLKVIKKLEKKGSEAEELKELRELPIQALQHLRNENLVQFGKIMTQNTELQRTLLAEIISKKADRIIKIAKLFKALGWKINGAGGNGGTITILFSSKNNARIFYKQCLKSLPKNYIYFEHILAS